MIVNLPKKSISLLLVVVLFSMVPYAHGSSISDLLDEGRNSLENHNFEEALDFFNEVLEIDETNISAMNNKAITYLRLNNKRDALATISKAYNLYPDDSGVLYNYGLILRINGNNSALEFFEKATTKNPELLDAWFFQGEILYEHKEYDKAINAYNQVLRIQPDHVDALYNLGLCYEDLKQFGDAVQMYDLALQVDPTYEKAWFNRGSIYEGFTNTSESINSFAHYIALNQSNPVAWFLHGKGLGNMGYIKDAEFSIRKATELDPENVVYQNYLSLYDEAATQDELVYGESSQSTPINTLLTLFGLFLVFMIKR